MSITGREEVGGTASAAYRRRRSEMVVSGVRKSPRTAGRRQRLVRACDPVAFCGVPSLTMLGTSPQQRRERKVPTLSKGAPAGYALGRDRVDATPVSPIEKSHTGLPRGGLWGQGASKLRGPLRSRVCARHPVAGVVCPCRFVRPGARHPLWCRVGALLATSVRVSDTGPSRIQHPGSRRAGDYPRGSRLRKRPPTYSSTISRNLAASSSASPCRVVACRPSM
jgi:hypothetical protein